MLTVDREGGNLKKQAENLYSQENTTTVEDVIEIIGLVSNST